MSHYFPNAQNFTINGGDFSSVQGARYDIRNSEFHNGATMNYTRIDDRRHSKQQVSNVHHHVPQTYIAKVDRNRIGTVNGSVSGNVNYNYGGSAPPTDHGRLGYSSAPPSAEMPQITEGYGNGQYFPSHAASLPYGPQNPPFIGNNAPQSSAEHYLPYNRAAPSGYIPAQRPQATRAHTTPLLQSYSQHHPRYDTMPGHPEADEAEVEENPDEVFYDEPTTMSPVTQTPTYPTPHPFPQNRNSNNPFRNGTYEQHLKQQSMNSRF